MYTLYEDVSKELGQALVSAWNWQHVWKPHAGDYLLSELSQDQEEITAEVVEDRSNPRTTGIVFRRGLRSDPRSGLITRGI